MMDDLTTTDLIRLLIVVLGRLEQMTAIARTLEKQRDQAEAELTTLRELFADIERWRESGDGRDLAYVLETADKYDAMKASTE